MQLFREQIDALDGDDLNRAVHLIVILDNEVPPPLYELPDYLHEIAATWRVLECILGGGFSQRRRFYDALQMAATYGGSPFPANLIAWPDVLGVLVKRRAFGRAVCQAALYAVIDE